MFRKSLPADFARQKVYVTSRADIRLLAPGLEAPAGDLFRVVRRYVQPQDVVWDIGSNLGLLTFSAAMRAGTQGRVYSLEADPRYADLQTRTLKSFSRDAAAISILCAAAADAPGILDFAVPKRGHARSHLSVVEGNSPGETDMTKQVVSLTLDWLLDYWAPPAFIKLDVEGAEHLALKGATRLFSEVRPVGYIECAESNIAALTEFFSAHRYTLFTLDEDGREMPTDRFAFNTIVKPLPMS